MAGPPRPKPPSAFDGYRRLERTRNVVTDGPVAVATARMPRARRLRARLAGSMRLAAFVAVLAVIIGTSVGLASADTAVREQPDAVSTPTGATSPDASATAGAAPAAEDSSISASAADDGDATATGVAEAAADTAVAGTPAAPAASSARRGSSLPFTGTPSVDRILIAGAALVLFGMLVQIAGQPLPARSHARPRR